MHKNSAKLHSDGVVIKEAIDRVLDGNFRYIICLQGKNSRFRACGKYLPDGTAAAIEKLIDLEERPGTDPLLYTHPLSRAKGEKVARAWYV